MRRLPHVWFFLSLLVLGIVITREVAMPPDDVVNMVHQIQAAIHPNHDKRAPSASPEAPEPSASQSGGPSVFNLPNVCGVSAAVAQHDLGLIGLKIKTVERHDRKAAGLVIEQAPSADARVLKGSTVLLTVSQGPGAVHIPDLKNQTAADAQTILGNLGLDMQLVRRHDMRATPGTVLGSQPAPGAVMRPGSAVLVIVSAGPHTGHIVPDVVGFSYDQAMAAAGQAGMIVEILRQSGDPESNVVKGQKPMAGTELTSPPPPLQLVLGPPAPSPSPSASAAPAPRSNRSSGGAGGDHFSH